MSNNKYVGLTIFFLCFSYVLVLGQNEIFKFGVIPKEQYLMEEYDLDKEAEAVVLYDIASSRFVNSDNSFNIIYERKTRIKILSEAGIKWSEIDIPFYEEKRIYEDVYEIEAYSYNYENGQINKTTLDLSNVFDEKVNESWNLKKFAIPNVKTGTIIEYRYKIKSPYIFNLREWEIQWRIPVIHSEYEIRMVPFYEYTFILQGAKKLNSQITYPDNHTKKYGSIKYKDNIHKLVMTEIPAFKNEAFITSVNDYIMKVDFQLSKINYPTGGSKEILTTWSKLNKDLVKDSDFGGYINKSEKLAKQLILEDTKKLLTDAEKFNYILDYVKKNYSWNKRNGKFARKSAKEFVKDKHGTSSEINLFTIGLLNAAGIIAKPVIISTRDNGKIRYLYPLTSYFNYVLILAEVNGINILTDATQIHNLNNRIPYNCINDKGLIVDKEKNLWANLDCNFISEIINGYYIEMENNDSLHTRIVTKATEYEALYYRNEYGDNQDNILKKLEIGGCNIIDSTIQVKNQLNKEKPYILKYVQKSKAEIINNKVYISPFTEDFLSENPLKENERTYPIDMVYPKRSIYSSTIKIPEGYDIDFLPESTKIENDLFNLSYDISAEKNKITVTFMYVFKKSIYMPENYLKIKNYFDTIIKKGNEKIVFSKISS